MVVYLMIISSFFFLFNFFFLNRLTIECRIEEKRISADKNQISELKMLVVMREGEEEVRAAVETTATTAKKNQ